MVDDGVVVPLVWPVGAWMGVGFHVDPLYGVEVTDTCMLVALPP